MPDKEETRAAQVRRPTEVIEPWYPTFMKISYINFARHKGTRRVERDSLLEKRRVYEKIEKELLVDRCIVLSPRPVHKERNPKATSVREIESGSRATGDTREVAVSRTKKHTRTIDVIEGRAV